MPYLALINEKKPTSLSGPATEKGKAGRPNMHQKCASAPKKRRLARFQFVQIPIQTGNVMNTRSPLLQHLMQQGVTEQVT